MIVGIVGSEAKKFTVVTETIAKTIIRLIIDSPDVDGVSSGHCHLGGVDIWAEEIGKELNKELYIFPATSLNWYTGYKPRNIQIATTSDVVHCITLATLPEGFSGLTHDKCYHCNTDKHVKSGGCWTAKYAERALGKVAIWHVID